MQFGASGANHALDQRAAAGEVIVGEGRAGGEGQACGAGPLAPPPESDESH